MFLTRLIFFAFICQCRGAVLEAVVEACSGIMLYNMGWGEEKGCLSCL